MKDEKKVINLFEDYSKLYLKLHIKQLMEKDYNY